uniref:Astacin domain-containing protein n=1 Tax=Strongyloides venezuelensis TaxID=75913 RepID=A0A0K0FCX5_STRVS
MNLYVLIVLISVINILQNVADCKHSRISKKLTSAKIPPYPTNPKPLMYYVSKRLGTKLVRLIKNELLFINDMAVCFSFKEQRSEVKKIGINFYRSSTNKVKLSTSKKKPTKVYMKKSLAENYSQFLFFIGLSMGLIPEITRNDSSQYVKVFSNNILSSNLKYYKEKNYESKFIANSSFDVYSVMLSPPEFGSRKGKKAYTFKSHLAKYYKNSVEINSYFKFNDYRRLWYLHCSDKCKRKTDYCKHGGYPRNDCVYCHCPPFFYGDKCEKIVYDQKICSNKHQLFASSSKKQYSIRNMQSSCSFLIKSKNRKKVQFNILNLKYPQKTNCWEIGFLEIKYREDKGLTGLLLCGNRKNISFPSLSSKVIVLYSGFNFNVNLTFSYKEV